MKNVLTPYNALPLLPPRVPITQEIFLKVISANKYLAELKGVAQIIPNQTIILNSLILQESKDSSSIENIITTNDELFKALTIDSLDQSTLAKEVLNYREALWTGFKLVKQRGLISLRDILKIQEIIVGNNSGIRALPGTALRNGKTGEVVYVPPVGKDVILKKMDNLIKFINTKDNFDPLIKMALIHYQFESIHPFYDGNGRTGRILNVLYLNLMGLLDLPILYLSSFILSQRPKYYEGLENVRAKNDWENWICFMMDSIEMTSRSTIQKIQDIRELLEEQIGIIKSLCPKIYSKEMVECLFVQPYCRINTFEEHLGISRFTASKYFKELESTGIIRSEKVGRDILFINSPLMELLTKKDKFF